MRNGSWPIIIIWVWSPRAATVRAEKGMPRGGLFNKLNVILTHAMRVSAARASHRWLRTIIESQLSAVRGWCEWSSSSRPIAHVASQWWWWGLI
jgi:hypothetical protein